MRRVRALTRRDQAATLHEPLALGSNLTELHASHRMLQGFCFKPPPINHRLALRVFVYALADSFSRFLFECGYGPVPLDEPSLEPNAVLLRA